MMKNLISIIVPIFNCENFLHRCIEGLINQIYKNIEIILVDDGSIDKSGKICDQYAQKDKRIKVVHQKNCGPAAARNTGIKISKGKFIFFVDADDFIKSNALGLLISKNHQHKTDLIVGDYIIKKRRSDPSTQSTQFLLPTSRLLNRQEIVSYVQNYLKKPTGYSLFVYVWGKLFKSSIIKKNDISFNENLPVFEDILFNFKYLKFASSVFYVKKHIYTYSTSDDLTSASNKIYDQPLGFKLALKSIGEFLQINGIKNNMLKKVIGNSCIFFTIKTMVRLLANTNISLKDIYRLTLVIINDPYIRENLKYYSPSKGDSKILPILIKLKLVLLIIFVCKYKAKRRYK